MSEIKDIPISDLKNLINFVKTQYDFDFSDYAMSSFKRRISSILLTNYISTIDELKLKLTEKEFYEEFLRNVTVNHTEMFRAPKFWSTLREDIIPQFSNNNTIRIWSAGCSSGEEVYSLAILLNEMGLADKVRIVASDINSKVIEKAKSGTYWTRSLETNESNYMNIGGTGKLSDYYTLSGDNYIMNKNLLKNITFREINLVSGTEFLKFDLILCRNVMIYFNPVLQDKVVSMFHKSLFFKGFLAVGEKETIAFCRSAEKFETSNSVERIYRKIKE